MCAPTQGVWQPAGCVSCELVCVCVSLVRVVIICLASTHTALVSSPSLAVLHLSTYLPTFLAVPCWRLLDRYVFDVVEQRSTMALFTARADGRSASPAPLDFCKACLWQAIDASIDLRDPNPN